MKHVSIKQAKDQLPALVRHVESGERVVITRNGKPVAEVVPLAVPLSDFEERLGEIGCTLLPVQASHAIAAVDPWPPTNDPFDPLLLAVCQVEGLRLVTRDRKLMDHPLAWPGASA